MDFENVIRIKEYDKYARFQLFQLAGYLKGIDEVFFQYDFNYECNDWFLDDVNIFFYKLDLNLDWEFLNVHGGEFFDYILELARDDSLWD